MAIQSGFFNSVDGDRLYDATAVNDFFKGFVTEGVLSPVGDWLQVSPGGALNVSVGSGKAWFMDTFITNSQARLIEIQPADVSFARIDVVVLDFNMDTRANSILVVEGTPSFTPSVPSLVDTPTNKQYALAHVAVAANETVIEAGHITNKIGTLDTPFCTGLLQQATTEDLLAQWDAEFNAWMSSIEADLLEIDLTGTLAELVEMRQRPLYRRNLLINGGMVINQRYYQSTVTGYDRAAYLVDALPGVADRWEFALGDTSGTWTLSRRDIGGGKFAYRGTVTTVPTVVANSYALFRQKIEGSMLGDVYKGTSQAKPMVLSFKYKTNTASTFVVELYDQHNDRQISKTFTHPGDGTYADYAWVIPEDFDAGGQLDLDETHALTVDFWLMAGSLYGSGTPTPSAWADTVSANRAGGVTNMAAAINNYWEFTDVQLEVGSIQSDFERPPLDEILRQCRRYREFHTKKWLTGCYPKTFQYLVHIYDPSVVPKRVLPTITYEYADIDSMSNQSHYSLNSPDPGAVINPSDYDDPTLIDQLKFTIELSTNAVYDVELLVRFDDYMVDAEL